MEKKCKFTTAAGFLDLKLSRSSYQLPPTLSMGSIVSKLINQDNR